MARGLIAIALEILDLRMIISAAARGAPAAHHRT
jgi:hypothetical protein